MKEYFKITYLTDSNKTCIICGEKASAKIKSKSNKCVTKINDYVCNQCLDDAFFDSLTDKLEKI